MNAPSSGSEPLPDEFPEEDDREERGNADQSEEAASDPEAARQRAEDALAEIEALADLEEEVGGEGQSAEGAPETPSSGEQTEAADEASPAEDEGTLEDQCENCGALLHGPYCSQCGQRAANRIVPIWHMMNEALEAVFELDLRVFRTFPRFVFLPGRLTKEYINGRRTRYIRPFRLYLFATFILFAVLAFTTTGGVGLVLDPQGAVRLNPPNTAITAPGTGEVEGAPPVFGDPDRREEIAQNLESDSTSITIDFFDDPETNRQVAQALRLKSAQVVRDPQAFVESLIDRGPYLMFLMLPIFALLLKLLYVRHGRLYAEHVIFSLHVHAFTFFAFTVGLLLESDTTWLSTAATWIELSPLLYLVLALSHVYEQGLLKSILKAVLLLLVYAFALLLGFLVFLVGIILLL